MTSEATTSSWGVALSLVGNGSMAVGGIWTKYVYQRQGSRPLYHLLAFLLYVVVPVPLELVASTLTPQSTLAPLTGIVLILNAFLSTWLLQERLTRQDWWSTAALLVGMVLTTCFGEHGQPVWTLDLWYARVSEGSILVWLLATGGLAIVGLFRSQRYVQALNQNASPPRLLLVLAYTSGFFNALTMNLLKLLLGLARLAWVYEDYQLEPLWQRWDSYILLGLALVSMTSYAWLSKQALTYSSPLLFVPLYTIFIILHTLVQAYCFFEEGAHLTRPSLFMFTLGVGFAILGLVILLYRPIHTSPYSATPDRVYETVSSSGRSSPVSEDGTEVLELVVFSAVSELDYQLPLK